MLSSSRPRKDNRSCRTLCDATQRCALAQQFYYGGVNHQNMFYLNLPIYTLRFCGDLEHTGVSNIKSLLKHLRVKNNGSYRMF